MKLETVFHIISAFIVGTKNLANRVGAGDVSSGGNGVSGSGGNGGVSNGGNSGAGGASACETTGSCVNQNWSVAI